jgi:hypothetical protein
METHAIRGKKVLEAAAQSAQHRRVNQQPERAALLAHMSKSINNGHTISAAAEHAYIAGFGPSAVSAVPITR